MKQAGFTAIELLVTLIVGLLLLFSAYQLYGLVLAQDSDSTLRANASNFAYELLRTDTTLATNPCSTVTVSNISIPAYYNLPSGSSATVQLSCVNSSTPSALSEMIVTVTYGSGKSVSHATYVNKS